MEEIFFFSPRNACRLCSWNLEVNNMHSHQLWDYGRLVGLPSGQGAGQPLEAEHCLPLPAALGCAVAPQEQKQSGSPSSVSGAAWMSALCQVLGRAFCPRALIFSQPLRKLCPVTCGSREAQWDSGALPFRGVIILRMLGGPFSLPFIFFLNYDKICITTNTRSTILGALSTFTGLYNYHHYPLPQTETMK